MAVRRTQSMLERGHSHPTRILIIKATAEIIKEKGIAGLHMDHVLASTGLTRGAVYHHFQNVDDLVEHALFSVYAEGVEANIVLVRDLLASTDTFAQFREGVLKANLLYAQNRNLRRLRTMRAHVMAATESSATVSAALASEQQRLTDEYVALIEGAQQKGWVRKELDPVALAVFIQAYSFGVIVDDVSSEHVDADAWARIIESFFENNIFAPQQG